MNKFMIAVIALFSTSAMADYNVVISKRQQTMSVYENGQLMDIWPVSTARKGYVTPTGSYRPYAYQLMHFLRNTIMRLCHIRYFYRGYAIHATPHIGNLGRPASMGAYVFIQHMLQNFTI
jgi:lipoprotein-anchoring transpeptidase ErfK/SrfK